MYLVQLLVAITILKTFIWTSGIKYRAPVINVSAERLLNTIFGLIKGARVSIVKASFTTSSVRSIDLDWRKRNGLCANPNGFGPLTNLPDFSYKDGRTAPLGVGQQARLLKQREFAKTVVKFCKEMDFAVERHNRLQKEEEQNRQRILDSKLKPKGKQWLETGSK